jgi:hypothetical protein
MSNSGKPGWPTSGVFPFAPFPIPGLTPPPERSAMSDGIDLLKSMWGNLPGSSQVPGFLVPTIDVEELDKRIADLRAAESWVEVNLNMLRATIQGLEVQRHTIVALKSLSAMPSPPVAAPPDPWPASPAPEAQAPAASKSAEADSPPAAAAGLPGLAAGNWLTYMQDQFAKVAEAALSSTGPTASAKAGAKTSGTKSVPKARKGRVAKR